MADVAEIQQKLETGVRNLMSEQGFQNYLRTQARFHTYSMGNVILILAQKPDATQVAGFHAWRDLGRSVRKGEHGIQILAPMLVKADTAGQSSSLVGEQPAGDAERSVTRFKVAHVFDVSQTDGAPLPELAISTLSGTSEAGQTLRDCLLEVAKSEGLTVRMDSTECGAANGFYRRATKEIHVKAGLAVDQQAKTLAHEMGHHRLGHGGGHGDARSVAEVQAESTAFTICVASGLDSTSYSLTYVAGWANGKDESERMTAIKSALAPVQRVAHSILTDVEGRTRTPEPVRTRTTPDRRAQPVADLTR